MPQTPGSLIEQIVCDADLFHLGTDEFRIRNEDLRQELSEISQEDLSKKKWRKMNIKFMGNHEYFTDYVLLKIGSPVQHLLLHVLLVPHLKTQYHGTRQQ